MTNATLTNGDFARFASQMTRNPLTLARLQEAMKDAERKKAIGERLSELRERRGFTQQQVADRVDTDKRNYQNWEAGGGTSGENYELLASVLGCSYDYLVTGADVTPPPGDILARLDAIEESLQQLRASLAREEVERAASTEPMHRRRRGANGSSS